MSYRHVLLLVVLWVMIWTVTGEPQPPRADAGGSLDSGQLLRLIVSDVTAELRPLIDRVVTRVEGLESRLGGIEARLNVIDFKQDSMDSRLGDLASQINAVNTELTSRRGELASRVDSVADRLSQRVDELASRVGSENVEQLSGKLDDLAAQVDELSNRTDVVRRLDDLAAQVDELSNRTDVVRRLDDLAAQVTGLVNQTEGQGQAGRADLPLSAPRDCSELPEGAQSGIHLIQPGLNNSGPPAAAFCDQNTDGGGWTVFQRRADIQPRLNFNRTWAAYRESFGKLDEEFWWGLSHLRQLTAPRDRRYQLRVELADFEGGRRYALYDRFRVASEADGFRLSLGSYSGDAGDSLEYSDGWKFSTWDRDNDGWPRRGNCAQKYGGGWWYRYCSYARLNAEYLSGERERQEGIMWYHWKGFLYSLKETKMMLRPLGTD